MLIPKPARVLLILLTLGIPAARLFASAAPPVDYRIEARLDPDKKEISGREVLTWTNYAPDPVDRLLFHLYLNAFSDKRSTFLSERRTWWARGSSFHPKKAGGCEVTRLDIDGLGDLTRSVRFVQPDDGNRFDRTVMEVPLPRPVRPGETLTIRILFLTRLPGLVARSGWTGDFFMAGQWFPKIGVLEPPGWRGAVATRWNCHQYHQESEFYANFGSYDVRLTLPSRFKVGATGKRVGMAMDPKAKTTTHRYVQSGVHDFAWAADPDFVEVVEKFSGDRDVPEAEVKYWAEILGCSPRELRLPDVTMILLMSPDHLDQTALHVRTLKEAIRGYGLMLGPYPYETITLIDPPDGGAAAGGMEYPTLFTAGTHAIVKYWPFNKIRIETVITHEYGHNYWYGMVAFNEFEEPWLDEGLNSFSEATVIHSLDPGRRRHELTAGRGMGSFQAYRSSYLAALPLHDPLDNWSWRFYPGQYGVNAYDRPVVTLLTLQNLMGREKFFQTFRDFQLRWRFRHPATADFVAAFAVAGGAPVADFLAQAIHTPGALDFSVDQVHNSPPESKTGLIQSSVRLGRAGTLRMPVDIRFRFGDGRTVRKTWPAETRWTVYRFQGKSPLTEVLLDPETRIALDTNLANNSWSDSPRHDYTGRWRAFLQAGLQHVLQLLSVLS
jgi:hypothetical protein